MVHVTLAMNLLRSTEACAKATPVAEEYSVPLGVAIAQASYATGDNHERVVLQKLLGELDLEGVLIQADALHTQQAFFGSSRSRGPTSS
jgi:hypothetical protein